MIRVLVIQGSPRQRSNSTLLTDQILQGITSIQGDVEVETISLREKQIQPCLACDGCHRKRGCVIEDDMQELYPLLDSADLLVVASPVYFNSVSAQLKALIDRTQAIWASKYVLHQPLIDREKKRLGVFVATAGNPEGVAEFTPSARVMELFFKAVNTLYYQNFFVTDTDQAPIQSRPELLLKAYELGAQLAQEYLNADKGGVTMSEDKLALLIVTDQTVAEIYKSILESFNIPALLRSDMTQSVYPLLGNVEILVPEEQLVEAQEVIHTVEIADDDETIPDDDSEADVDFHADPEQYAQED